MANEQNLKPIRDSQRARELQEKAAIKQRENIARRKTLKEELLLLLAQGNTQEKISLALIQKALKGDTKAFEVIRDSIGEKPTEKQEISGANGDKFELNINVIKE
jgi:uncharacterized protein (DUF2336 family)